jgi:uncharacterized protein involved in response to NO
MLFGFSAAVIAGFLLTAVANWTGRETAVGLPLLALCALWLLGRLGLFFGAALPRNLPALLDLGFLPALAFACARPIVAARNRRNYALVGLLFLLSLANAASHFGVLQQHPGWTRSAHRVALDLILLVILLITGRVVPLFTRNASRSDRIRALPALELAATVSLALSLLAETLALPTGAVALFAGLAGAFALARMRHWGTMLAFREPLLWVLHLGALWLPLGLLLRAASSLWPSIPQSSALHALTTGAIGTLTLGMMARVSLGHTGRALRAPGWIAVAFAAIVAAGLLRVVGPFLPAYYMIALTLSAGLWALAFATFLMVYTKVLIAPPPVP